jgi:hypothetical protein
MFVFNRTLTCWVALTGAGLAALQAAHADTNEPGGASAAVRTLEPSYFEEFAPITALDMVNRVPGFSLSGGEQVRGFSGAAGNVLIDGQRPSAKNLSLSAVLSRIPATSVARIELIDATNAGLEGVQSAFVVNVVRNAGADNAVSAEVQVDQHGNGFLQPQGKLSWSGSVSGVSATVGVEAGIYDYFRRIGAERVIRPDQSIISSGKTTARNTYRQGSVTLSLGAKPAPDVTWSFNAKAGWERFIRRAETDRSFTALPGIFEGDEFSEGGEGPLGEIGGDISIGLAGGSLKVVGLVNGGQFAGEDTFDRARNGVAVDGNTFQFDDVSGEALSRLSWARAFGRQRLELGLEGAYNVSDRDNTFSQGIRGARIPQVLSLAQTKVEERRLEGSVTHTFNINPALTIESGFRLEQSTITQTGDALRERSFTTRNRGPL